MTALQQRQLQPKVVAAAVSCQLFFYMYFIECLHTKLVLKRKRLLPKQVCQCQFSIAVYQYEINAAVAFNLQLLHTITIVKIRLFNRHLFSIDNVDSRGKIFQRSGLTAYELTVHVVNICRSQKLGGDGGDSHSESN